MGLDELFRKNGIKLLRNTSREWRLKPGVEAQLIRIRPKYVPALVRVGGYVLRGQARYINATEGGANIDGFDNIALEQVLSELGPRSDRLSQYASANPYLTSWWSRLELRLRRGR